MNWFTDDQKRQITRSDVVTPTPKLTRDDEHACVRKLGTCTLASLSEGTVSTDAQQKEGTIERQVLELKRRVGPLPRATCSLVKEYVDNRV
jgi:hypothetical protein